jgi:hypothetical protein
VKLRFKALDEAELLIQHGDDLAWPLSRRRHPAGRADVLPQCTL